jgi:hypothetical protein
MKKRSYVTHLSPFRQPYSVLYKHYQYKSVLFKQFKLMPVKKTPLKHKITIRPCTVKLCLYNAPSLWGKDVSGHRISPQHYRIDDVGSKASGPMSGGMQRDLI